MSNLHLSDIIQMKAREQCFVIIHPLVRLILLNKENLGFSIKPALMEFSKRCHNSENHYQSYTYNIFTKQS